MISSVKLGVLIEANLGDTPQRLKLADALIAQVGASSTATASRAARLTDTYRLQERQLATLQAALGVVAKKYGESSPQADRAQQAIDRLSASMRNNERQLELTIRKLSDPGPWEGFRQIAIGALREVGELGVQALLRAGQALGDLASQAASAYISYEALEGATLNMVAAEMRRADSSLTMTDALTAASGKSEELLRWQQLLAVNSPFSEEGIAQAFRTAQAYGFVSETANRADVDARRLTNAIVDFTAGTRQTEETAKGIALALGQIQAKGRVSAEEMNQLAERGIAARDILADAFGVTTQELIKMQEKGLIPADRAVAAIVDRLENDYAGAAARASDTFGGTVAKLEELKNISLREFFAGTAQALQAPLNEITDALSDPAIREGIREMGQDVGALIGAIVDGAQFIASNANPAIAGLTAVTVAYAAAATTQAIPAITAKATALTAQASAAIAAAGGLGAATTAAVAAAAPFLALGAAVYGVVRAYQILGPEMDDQAKRVLQDKQFWLDSAAAQEAYANASSDVREAAADEAAALDELREKLQAHLAELGRRRAMGMSDEEYAREIAGLAGWRAEIEQATAELNREIGVTEQAAQAQTDLAMAHDASGQAAQQQAQEMAKLQKELEQISDRARDAYDALISGSADAQSAMQELATEHADKLASIDRDAANERASIAGDYHARLAEIDQDGQRQQADLLSGHQAKLASIEADAQAARDDLARDGAARRADIDRETEQQRADQARDHAEKLAEIDAEAEAARIEAARELAAALAEVEADGQQRRADLESDYQGRLTELDQESQQERAALEADYQSRRSELVSNGQAAIQELERDHVQALADLQAAAQDAQADLASDHADKLVSIQQDSARAQEQIAIDAAARIADAYRDQARSLEDVAIDQDRKLADLQENAAEKQEDLERDHQRKLADLQREQAEATTDEQRAKLAERIADEKARYEQRRANLQLDLEREIADANEAAERKREDLNRRLEQEIEDQRIALMRKRQAAAEQAALQEAEERAAYERRVAETAESQTEALAEEQAGYQKRLAEAEAAQIKALEEERAGYEERRAELERATAEQLADEQATYAERLADLQAATAERQTEIRQAAEQERAEIAQSQEQATEEERAGYARRREEAIRSRQEDLADLARSEHAKLEEIARTEQAALTEEQTSYATRREEARIAQAERLADEQASYAERQAALNASLAAQREAERARYEEQRAQAAEEQARQLAEQRRALGEQLIDYVENMRARGEIAGPKAREITEALKTEYGVQATVAEESFARAQAAIAGWASGSQGDVDTLVGNLGRIGDEGVTSAQRIQALADEEIARLRQALDEGEISVEQFIEALGRVPTRVETEILARTSVRDERDAPESERLGRLRPEFRAAGGPVLAGRSYIVGERRPELLIPQTSGTVLPYVPSGGGEVTVIINNAGTLVAQADLVDQVRNAVLEHARREGSLGLTRVGATI